MNTPAICMFRNSFFFVGSHPRRGAKTRFLETEVPPRGQRHGWSYGETMRASFLGVVAVSFIACEQRVQLSGDGCDLVSCAGCCSAQGCVPFVLQSNAQCGTQGNSCSPCASGLTCNAGLCGDASSSQCGACSGCCLGLLGCQSGTSAVACGKGGVACTQCPSNQECLDGRCQFCGPASCAGCCNGVGQCESGTSDFGCGTSGNGCDLCGPQKRCIGGRCQ